MSALSSLWSSTLAPASPRWPTKYSISSHLEYEASNANPQSSLSPYHAGLTLPLSTISSTSIIYYQYTYKTPNPKNTMCETPSLARERLRMTQRFSPDRRPEALEGLHLRLDGSAYTIGDLQSPDSKQAGSGPLCLVLAGLFSSSEDF